MVMDVIKVQYKDYDVGALSFDEEQGLGAFQYTESFIKTGIQLAPLMMPLSDEIYIFPELNPKTFKGLPGMIADSLPDDFGNHLLNAWVASQGRISSDITPLERLQYTGTRGMGALEYLPAQNIRGFNASQQIQISSLVQIAQEVLDKYSTVEVNLQSDGREDREAMLALLSVGTSAGGARPKAVLAFNDTLTEVRSGQTYVPEGFNHYLMKFDGVTEHNRTKETFGDPMGFGAMEYVYYLMAISCGISMMPSRLLHEGNRRHFITKRFDRNGNQKIHTTTLNGIAHIDYKSPGSFSYEELIMTIRKLKLSAIEAEQIVRRMIFNTVARNHDDHAKNFAFILDDNNKWNLAPAYDVAYSYKPGSDWVNQHWMSLNGKRDNFILDDLLSISNLSPLFTKEKINKILNETIKVVSNWSQLAQCNDVPDSLIEEVQDNLRLHW